MSSFISVVIPCYNGSGSIGICLAAVCASRHDRFEVIVVDDASADSSPEIVSAHPCRLIRLDRRSGASTARNAGASAAAGDTIFFIDADCVVFPDTLSSVDRALSADRSAVVGGSYSPAPYDPGFFNAFQSVFINYSELRSLRPDYVASHAMAIDRQVFLSSGGFLERFMPIIEDVELSHRLRRSGHTLKMDPSVLVRHVFGFGLVKSLKNAFRKSRYWTAYSIGNRDLLRDSGTASLGLKANVLSFGLSALALACSLFITHAWIFGIAAQVFNLFVNRGLIRAFQRHGGSGFGILAAAYYILLYAPVVGMGALAGFLGYRAIVQENAA